MTHPQPCTLTAYDGADDDGGTLYVLANPQGEPIASHPWPSHLEELARRAGLAVIRAAAVTGLECSAGDPDRTPFRRP